MRKATPDIPIVFALVADPVGTGLVSSLSRPGGNITGLSTQNIETSGKRLELLREFVPNLKRLGIMTNVANLASVIEMREIYRRPPLSVYGPHRWKSAMREKSRPPSPL